MASFMLLDVGRNLRVARPSLLSAIRDEDRLEAADYKGAYPFTPTTAHDWSNSLRCVLRKLDTGRKDAKLCRYLDGMRN
jgi:hypothetical protein